MEEGTYWPGWYDGPSSSDDESLFGPMLQGLSLADFHDEFVRRGRLYKEKKLERRQRRENERRALEELPTPKYYSDLEEEAEFSRGSVVGTDKKMPDWEKGKEEAELQKEDG